MLKPLGNHEAGSTACRRQLSQPTRRNGGLLVGPMQIKIKPIMIIKYIAIDFVQARQIGLKVNAILGTEWVDGTVRDSSSDDPTQSQIGRPAQRKCNTAHVQSRMLSGL